jgi:hypothetical protein
VNLTRPAITPYKGLVPYDEADAPFFFGREHEREIISANLLSSRLTLLYGPSGVGKSSVLRAGVVAHLREVAVQDSTPGEPGDFVMVLFDAWRDAPLQELARVVRDTVASASSHPAIYESALDRPLTEMLEQWTGLLDRDVLIILDQFEEYFLYHPSDDGEGTLPVELPRALNRRGLRANFIISIRDDSLARLDLFKGRVPNLFDNYLRIDHLDLDAARLAIMGPIEEYNSRIGAGDGLFSIEPGTVNAVLAQVQTGQVLLGDVGVGVVPDDTSKGDPRPRVETPYLQLVMTRLWNEETTMGSKVLRLQTLKDLGGAERIIRTHLDAAMSALPEMDCDVAARAFRFLVTPSGAKIAHSIRDLADYVELSEARVLPVVERLARGDVRILRPVAPPPDHPGPMRYQIFHDVLAPAILDWRNRYTRAREVEEAERRTDQDLVIERLQARIWTATKVAAIGGLLLTGLVLASLLNNADTRNSLAPGPMLLGLLVGFVLLVSQGQTWLKIRRAARKARKLGFSTSTVLELLSDRKRDGVELVAGGGKYRTLDEVTRHQLRRARVVTALSAWLASAMMPLTLMLGLALGARGFLQVRGVVAVAVIPPLTVFLLAVTAHLWDATRMLTGLWARGRHAAPPMETVARAPRWLVTAGGSGPIQRGAWKLPVMFMVAWILIAASGIVSALIAAVPVFYRDVFTTLFSLSPIMERSKRVDIGSRYRLSVDPAISPLAAGQALYSLSQAGEVEGTSVGLPVPRKLPAWIPSGPNPFGDDWTKVVGTLVSRAKTGFSPAQREFLERIGANPGFKEYDTLARAGAVDWPGARFNLPFPKKLSASGFPVPRPRSIRRASEAQIARAALFQSRQRMNDAEIAIREVISAGLVLRDSSTSTLGALNGIASAQLGLDSLEAFYEGTNRSDDAAVLRDARLATTPTAGVTPSVGSRADESALDIVQLIRDLQDKALLRGIRWERVLQISLMRCSTSRELIFGLDNRLVDALQMARADLVRSPAEDALFDLVTTRFATTEDLNLGIGPTLVLYAGHATTHVLGSRWISECMQLLPMKK